jgi:hypothetical protein
VEEFGADILRRHVLAKPNSNLKQIVSECLKQWQARFRITDMAKEEEAQDF